VRSLVRLILVVLVAGIGVAALGVVAAPEVARMATSYRGTAGPLPPFATLAQPSLVFDAAGKQIDEGRIENRQPFKITDVPRDVLDAIVAVEDAGFWIHKGVNAKGVIRAGLANTNAGGNTQGGSTITQQLIKNALTGSRRDARRKVLEAAYAWRLEQQWTKEEILERYLNTIYFGNNAYGLQAAAETYFGKGVNELDLYEGAFLAGLIQNPVGYDPVQRNDRSRRRYKDVMQRLVAVKKIDQATADRQATGWPLPDRLKRDTKPPAPKSYFAEKVRRQLLKETNILGTTDSERYQAFFRGGLKIYTTQNEALQVNAELARDEQMPDTNGRIEAAIVSLDTKTGAVVAMVGGRDYQASQVNLALTPRQTGSSVKGFILAAAINAGIQNNDTIDGTLPCTWVYPDKSQPNYTVDDGVSASGTIEQMTWSSINCAYVRMYFAVGGLRVIQTMRDLGVKGKLDDLYTFAVGGNEISPLDMAAGYATLANQGVRHEPYYIERIEDRNGQVFYQHQDGGVQAIDAGVALRSVDIMKGVLRQGTAANVLSNFDNGRPAAGKTGTYDKDKHAWFVGFTPQFTTAVYMGNPRDPNDQMIGIPQFKKYYAVHGGTYPSEIWKQYMTAAHFLQPVEDWPKPPPAKRPPARVYAPFQDCFAVLSAAPAAEPDPDADPTDTTQAPQARVVAAKPKLSPVTGDPADLTGPAATVPPSFITYPCWKGPPAPPPPPKPKPKPTTSGPATTVAGAPGAATTPPAGGAATTVAATTTTKKK
jgi:penicillin-binding protein 1A